MTAGTYTFAYRGEADEVRLVQRVTGRTELPMRRADGADEWTVVLEVPAGCTSVAAYTSR